MRRCPLCDKGPQYGGRRHKLRGKYNPIGTVVRFPNLQWAPLPKGGRIKICTKCIKGGKNLEVKSK